jgi:uncharacterized repeat protein (TIGR03803 family)
VPTGVLENLRIMNRKAYRRFSIRPLGLWLLILAAGAFASARSKEKVLYSFHGNSDGATPAGGVVFDPQGNLYGATSGGGSGSCAGFFQCGTVYQLSPPTQKGGAWTETVLYNFQGSQSGDGASPAGGLVIDKSGNLYGTTGYGGTGDCVLLGTKEGCGTVFELSPPKMKGGAWTETVLYSFKGDKDGYVPNGDLVFDSAGNLYGATTFGGGKGTTCNPLYQYCGTVFELSPPQQKGGKWTERVLHSFAGGTDGANPNGGLVLGSDGTVYGSASSGGNQGCKTSYSVGCGTIFELTTLRNKAAVQSERILHRFKGYPHDGSSPSGGLISDRNGTLYGTAGGGGKGHGLVFGLVPPTSRDRPWTETLLHSFTGADGAEPAAGLTFDSAGSLYGTACCDGRPGGGTIFRLTSSPRGGWTFTVLHSFTGGPDGSYPASSLILDGAGNLYGTTRMSGNTGQNCGHDGCGTVFDLSP